MKKLPINLLALFGLLAFALPANAIDLGEIELGKVYQIPDFESVTGTITPALTGKLVQDGVADITLQGVESSYAGYGQYGQVHTYQVTAGTTYTVSCDFVWSGGSVVFYQEGSDDFQLSATDITPEAGSALSPISNYTGDIVIKFNTEVKCNGATLNAGSESVKIDNSSKQGNTLAFNIAKAINTFFDNGAITKEGGTPLQLVISGLQTQSGVLYDGTGVMTIDYVSAPKLAALVSAVNCANGTAFKSYYKIGDPAAELTFIFDSDLVDGAFLSIGAGNPELDSYIYEELPCVVEGKTIKCSLAGKLRDFTSVITTGEYVAIKLNNVKDTNGNYAQASVGNVGSYPYTFIYDYIEPFDITSEFVPATGASLEDVNSIEIAFNHADQLTYGGVLFTYVDADGAHEVKVPAAEISTSLDSDWATLIVNKPAELVGKKSITVNLYDLQSNDGYNHTAAIQAEYDKFVVTLIGPYTQGAVIDRTGDDDWVITCNADPGYLRYDFYNKITADSPEGWYYGTQFNKQDDGTWTAYNANAQCFTDFQPYMLVRAYDEEATFWNHPEQSIGEYVITFEGSNRPFTYSDINFVSVTPANQSVITAPVESEFCFTVEFDGLVALDMNVTGINEGFGSKSAFTKVIPVGLAPGDDTKYAHTWQLYPGAETINSRTAIEIAVKAFDLSGYVVKGNMGGDENDFLSFEYTIDNPSSLLPLDITPATGSTVTSLSKFTLSYQGKAVGINYGYTGDEKPRIVNNMQEEVYVFSGSDIDIYSDVIGMDELGYPIYDEITVIEMTVNPEITADGSYMLIVPAHYFIIGDQFVTSDNEEMYAYYTIGGTDIPVEDTVLFTNPESGSQVDALERIDILADGIEEAMIVNDGEVTITDATGAIVFSESVWEMDGRSFDWGSFAFLGFYIEPGITTDGTYVLDIPAGIFEFANMSTNAAFTGIYTVDNASGITSVLVETADRYDVFTVQGVRVLSTSNAADLKVLRKGLYIINGRKVMVK